jgi:hypothetical protein
MTLTRFTLDVNFERRIRETTGQGICELAQYPGYRRKIRNPESRRDTNGKENNHSKFR